MYAHERKKRREEQERIAANRNYKMEKEIGVHPKYRNRQSRYTQQDVKDWEALAKKWKMNNV